MAKHLGDVNSVERLHQRGRTGGRVVGYYALATGAVAQRQATGKFTVLCRGLTTTASRPFVLPGFRLHLGKLGRGLLDVGREVRELLHLANLDHLGV